jgi:hypothetical protein
MNAGIFHRAIDIAMPPKPPGLRLHLFAGDTKKTASRATAARGDRGVRFVEYGPGDDTVLRSSALLDERPRGSSDRLNTPIDWDSVTFLSSDHAGLVRDPLFLRNVLYRLYEEPK